VVVLLNFLISYIGEVYSEVYSVERMVDEFKGMAILNYESKTIFKFLAKIMPRF
jgi:hypothetical protein